MQVEKEIFLAIFYSFKFNFESEWVATNNVFTQLYSYIQGISSTIFIIVSLSIILYSFNRCNYYKIKCKPKLQPIMKMVKSVIPL